MRISRWKATACLLAAGSIVGPAAIAAPTDVREIAEIRDEITRLRQEYDRRIGELERRLAALEPDSAGESGTAAGDDGIDDLRAAAREAAARVATDTDRAPAGPVAGREGNLNQLNPEISATGIFLGTTAGDGRDEFSVQEVEVDLQAALDPFSRTRFTLALGDEELELEEGWVNYSALPGGLDLTAGRFRQRFGPLNRQHLHALPQSDYPLVHQTFFGDEGLAQTGLSFAWLLPKPWASANEIVLEVTNAENETAFSGESFDQLALLGRLTNYWDLSPTAYLEWGVSGITGETDTGGDARLWGTDLTFRWQPPSRARGLTWRSELIRSERDDPAGVRRDALGGYTYLEGLLARDLRAGVRLDWVEDALDPERETRGLVPYLTWWQSEFVRLRAEYGLLEDRTTGRTENRFTLQLTWAAGPHKHETY